MNKKEKKILTKLFYSLDSKGFDSINRRILRDVIRGELDSVWVRMMMDEEINQNELS